jgi:7-cyano-7-deazaguanine synthase
VNSKPTNPLARAAVLLSGGLDSTVLLHHLARDRRIRQLWVLSFDYGQRHRRELAAARWQAAALARVREHRVVRLPALAALAAGRTALLPGGPPVPDLARVPPAARDQPPTYVPNRNLVLLALAAAYAEACGCPVLFYGAHAGDQHGYWDCTPLFVRRLNRVLALNRRRPVRVEAPFAGQAKSALVRRGVRLGVDFAHTWSCYRGGRRPCGRCPTCVERAGAFAAAGAVDPLAASGSRTGMPSCSG